MFERTKALAYGIKIFIATATMTILLGLVYLKKVLIDAASEGRTRARALFRLE